MLSHIWFTCTNDPGFTSGNTLCLSGTGFRRFRIVFAIAITRHILPSLSGKIHPSQSLSLPYRVLLWSMGLRWSPLWGRRPWKEPRRLLSRQTSSLLWPWRCSREPPRLLTVVSSGSGGEQHHKARWKYLPYTSSFVSVWSSLIFWSPPADIHLLRPHPGQIEVALRFRSLLDSDHHPSQIAGQSNPDSKTDK